MTACRKCGKPLTPYHAYNSGTTEIVEACPEAQGVVSQGRNVLSYNGHDYRVMTTYKHAATGCCSVDEIRP